MQHATNEPQHSNDEIRLKIPKIFQRLSIKGMARIVGVSTAIVTFILLSGGFAYAANLAKERGTSISALTSELSTLTTQVTALEGKLGETEEGKKKLEEVNQSLEQEKDSAEGRAETAEQKAAKTLIDLNKVSTQLTSAQNSLKEATASLDAKKAELSSVQGQVTQRQNELNAKTAELNDARECVALFNNAAKNTLGKYDQAAANTIQHLLNAVGDAASGNYTLAEYELNQAQSWAGQADTYYYQLQSIFGAISAGSC